LGLLLRVKYLDSPLHKWFVFQLSGEHIDKKVLQHGLLLFEFYCVVFRGDVLLATILLSLFRMFVDHLIRSEKKFLELFDPLFRLLFLLTFSFWPFKFQRTIDQIDSTILFILHQTQHICRQKPPILHLFHTPIKYFFEFFMVDLLTFQDRVGNLTVLARREGVSRSEDLGKVRWWAD
jgi:hypothetical protein